MPSHLLPHGYHVGVDTNHGQGGETRVPPGQEEAAVAGEEREAGRCS